MHDAAPPRYRDGDPLAARIVVLAERLADRLSALGIDALEFLTQIAADLRAAPRETSPALDRTAAALALDDRDLDLLVLAGLGEHHEGFCSLFARLHPRSEPYPTVALAAQLLAPSQDHRGDLSRRLWRSPLLDHGLVEVAGGGPFPTRDLRLGEGIWPALHGVDAWPRALTRDDGPIATVGLEEWLAGPAAAAVAAVAADADALVVVHAADPAVASARAAALVRAAARAPLRISMSEKTVELARLACAHALLRGAVPVFSLAADGPGRPVLPALRHCGAVVLAARTDAPVDDVGRPLLPVACTRLPAAALRRMWADAAPSLAAHVDVLAARFPLEPAEARALVDELGDALDLDVLVARVRARAFTCAGAGIKVVAPAATWRDLVLPDDHVRVLHDAVDRVRLQPRVLDEWGFLAGRAGARGVRMLLCGPPGTGKTLSAEVLAHALATDLLIVDVSRVVSKWIGETEKNLAAAFDAAERARAVLLFDEADALFGKRTEIADAHDRYANLETAYLLSRLERYDGLAVLTTNLRQNIDPAFVRRMDFIVDFETPGRDERAALWRCHVPAGAPVAADVVWHELAGLYPVAGGVIRNATLAAAYFAAADDAPISRAHLVRALRREYEKLGKAFPTPHPTQGTPHRG